MSRSGGRWRSIERQLPLLISSLLLVTIAIFASGAYARVRHELLATADQRLMSAAVSMDALFSGSMVRYGAAAAKNAAQPALVQFLTTGRGAPAARAALASVWAGDPAGARMELRRPDGTVVLDTTRTTAPPPPAWLEHPFGGKTNGSDQPRIGPLVGLGDSTYFLAVAPVLEPLPPRAAPSGPRRVLGYLTDLRLLSPQNASQLRALIGDQATMLVGSPGGIWTDLEHRRAPPPRLSPMTEPAMVTDGDGRAALGLLTAVRGTPWFIWLQQPLSVVLAPMHTLLIELASIAGLVLLVGAGGAWTVSRHFTTPIVSLTGAAERIAATHAPTPATDDVSEMERLGDAFERMAARVRDSLATAEAARAEAVATAEQLQKRSAELEEQTHEAQALAEELEQQFEEAQALSEQLDDSNAQLHTAVANAESARLALQDIVESITDAFIAYDREWRVTFINRRAAEYFRGLGVGEGAFEGRNVWEMFPDVRGTTVERQMRRAMEEQVTVAFETVANDRQWLAIRAYPTRDGGLTAVWTDITETKRSALATAFLAEASGRLSASLEVEATLRDVARSVVPALADWCAVDVITDPGTAIWPPPIERVAVVHDDPEQVAFAMEFSRRYPVDWNGSTGLPRTLRTGQPQFVPAITPEMIEAAATSDAHLADLRRFRFSSFLMVPLIARGRPLGALSLAMTESGRRFDERDLALAQNLADRAAIAVDNAWLFRETDRARTAAEMANKSKLDFLASMSHELRTPLNAIAGYVQLLEMQVAGPVIEEQRRYLARIARAQSLLLGRINDMLNFVKIGSGTLSYAVHPIRVHDALAGLDSLIQPQLTERGLAYEYAPTDTALMVSADPEKLDQIMLNLLSNAIKFTPRGGRITVACRPRVDQVEISVSDTGIGIAAEKLPTIFEPFVQLNATLTSDREGTGLGLSISRDLARGMGGDLTAASTPGVGSTFTLTLPHAPVAAPSTALSVSQEVETSA